MDLQKQYDVIIAGGGPAASALSMYVDEKLRVLVVEKRHLLDPSRMYEREKCCGGMKYQRFRHEAHRRSK